VDLIASRFRGVLIAIVVLGLSAGAVFAGHVVLQAPATAPTASEQGDQNEDADATDNEAPDGTEDGSGNTADNHGALVSMAAQMDTPAGFANHGAFVSCVAKMKSLPEGTDPATFLAALTPEICAAAAAATADEAGTQPTDNHGALVSMAAQMDTPAGFANHGAFVSCVAQMKDVTDAATFDFSTVTVESCAAAAAADKAAKTDAVHGKAGQHGKGRGHKPS
jgi:hypothetical protein